MFAKNKAGAGNLAGKQTLKKMAGSRPSTGMVPRGKIGTARPAPKKMSPRSY